MSQKTSKLAVITIAGVAVGGLKDVEWGFRNRPITDYDISGGDPAVHEPGDNEYFFRASIGWIVDTHRANVKATKVVIIVDPEGSVSTFPRHTLTDVILNYTERVERGRIIMVNIEGSYRTESIGVVP
jgi:sporulation protein YlmC with PRC-barrel domain